MKKNMGSIDTVIRILMAVSLLLTAYFKVVTGLTAIIFLALAGVLLLTSFIGFCPMYAAFGLSTRRKETLG